MKTINEQIAEKVMGWKMVSSPTKITDATYVLGHTNREIANVFIPDWGNRIKPFKPDTSPADAFEVLKACAKGRTLAVNICDDGKARIGEVLQEVLGKSVVRVIEADTLQAAISAFALRLFP